MKENKIKSNFKDNYPGYKLDNNFNPKGKKFMFRLSKHDCYKISTGKCSHELKDISKVESSPYARECEACYCIDLVNSMQKNGINNEITITKFSCGHYVFGDGQHRVCSAAKKGAILPVYIQEGNIECYHCYLMKKSFIFKLKSIFKRNKVFIEQL